MTSSYVPDAIVQADVDFGSQCDLAIRTHSPWTGDQVNADRCPTWTTSRDGVTVQQSQPCHSYGDGMYVCRISLTHENGYAVGDKLTISVVATVCGVRGESRHYWRVVRPRWWQGLGLALKKKLGML